MFDRRHVKTRSELVRAELGESLALFQQAAAHAAGGMGASVGPGYNKVLETAANVRSLDFVEPVKAKVTNAASASWDSTIAALAPLAEAARQGSAKGMMLDSKGKPGGKKIKVTKSTVETESSSGGHTTMWALLAAGAALGATGALVARKRNRAKWAEYEPSSLSSEASDLVSKGSATVKSKSSDMRDGMSDGGGTVTKATTWAKDHAKSAVGTVKGKLQSGTPETVQDMGSSASSAAGKTADKVNEGAHSLADKTDVAHNDASSRMADSGKRTAGSVDDEVDELLRSSKNGRM